MKHIMRIASFALVISLIWSDWYSETVADVALTIIFTVSSFAWIVVDLVLNETNKVLTETLDDLRGMK